MSTAQSSLGLAIEEAFADACLNIVAVVQAGVNVTDGGNGEVRSLYTRFVGC